MLWKQILLATKNLGRNRRRNAATASSIILGYAGLALLSGFVVHIEKFFRATSIYLNHVGSVSVYKTDGVEKHLLKPEKYSLSEVEAEKVKQIFKQTFPEAEAITTTLSTFILLGNGCETWPVKTLGIEPEVEKLILSHPAIGSYAPEILKARKGTHLWQHANVVPLLVTPKVARNLGKSKLHSPDAVIPTLRNTSTVDCTSPNVRSVIDEDTNVQLAGRTFGNALSALDGEIVGHYNSGLELLEESSALVPINALQSLLETKSVTNVVAYLPWQSIPEIAERRLQKALKSENLDLEVHHYRSSSVNPFYVGFMNLIYVMSAFFLGLAVSVVTLTVSDAITMSVLERTREIGTLRALGFRQKDIPRIFSLEGKILALLCVPVGWLIAYLTSSAVNASHLLFEVPGIATQIHVNIMLDPVYCTWIGLLLVIVSALAGWFVSFRTSRKEVARLLNQHVS